MGKNDDRVQWAQVPDSGGELWASDAGDIATLKPSGGFDTLTQRENQDGELYVRFRGGRKTTGKRMVAAMALAAFDQPRLGGHAVAYRDGDTENCRLENLFWQRKGQVPVGDMKPKRCLGNHCGHATFMSTGANNHLCPACTRVNESRGDAEGVHVPGEIPDAPSLYPPRGEGKG